MGILNKIEDKLSGNKHNADGTHEQPLYSGNERKSLERQAEQQNPSHGHGTSNTSGSGYGNSGHQGTGSRAEELRHPVQTNTAGQRGDGYGNSGHQAGTYEDYSNMSGGPQQSGSSRGYGNDGYGQQSGRDKMLPAEPVDPRSVRGQNQMANASHGGQGYGATGEPGRDYADTDRSRHGGITNALHGGQDQHGTTGAQGRDYTDTDRSRHGGISNALHGSQGQHGATGGSGRDYTDTDRSQHSGGSHALGSGGRSSIENYDAIPTAGGEKLGTGGSGSGHDQHHYGRDAALAGGAAAAGEHEHRRHHDQQRGDDRHLGRGGYDQPGVSSADQYGGQNLGSRQPQEASYAGNDRSTGVGAGGIGGQGMGVGSGHHGHHGHHDNHGRDNELSGGLGQQAQGMPTEKKMGGAYEAGYRDAMAHLEADRKN